MRDGSGTTCVELKYWSRHIDIPVHGERFTLANQGAQDLSRYDFLKDLQRVERAVAEGLATRGYVIALSNDQGFWGSPRPGTIDADFRLHEGRILSGPLRWGIAAGAGTMRGRETVIELSGKYELNWRPYSQVTQGSGGEFRYLLVDVDSPPVGSARLPAR